MAGSWEVRRDVLLEAVRILDLVPSQSGIPSSDFFMVVPDSEWRLWMTTAAGAVAMVKVDGTGIWPFKKPFFLDRRLFTPFVSTFREIKNKFPFEFSKTEAGELRVRCGRPFMDFSAQPSVMGYAKPPKLENESKLVISEELLEMLKCAADYSASEAGAPHLACVYLTPQKNGLEILASNQKIVFRAMYRGGHSVKNVIAFPLPMLGVLSAEGLQKLIWSDPFVFAKFSSGIVWQSVSAEAAKNFPAVELRKGFAHGANLNGVYFKAGAIKFANVIDRLSTYLQYVRKEDWVLNISGTKGAAQLFLVSRLPNAIINEHMRVLVPLPRSFKFDWPLDQLGSAFRFFRGDDAVIRVDLDEEQGMSFLKCGAIEMAMSTKRT